MFKQQLYFQSMLDWCRNLQPHEESCNELTIIEGIPITQPHTTRKQVPPKFAFPIERRLNSDTRRGIKTHFSRVVKLDKETQTIHKETQTIQKDNSIKYLKDCGTQTGQIVIHSLGSKRNSKVCSRSQSPGSKLERTNIVKVDNLPTERTNLLEVSKGTLTLDYKNQVNRETKASYNMLESQEKVFPLDDRSYQQVRNIESYHISNDRPKNQQLLSVPPHPIMRNKLPHRQVQFPAQRMVQSIRNTIDQEHDQNTFSQKYKTIMRNVESEFKLSEKKHSERKIRYTPDKRILFQERQTIISKYGQSYQDEKSLRVEESLVYDRDVRAFFTNLPKIQVYDTFVMFLALENVANVAITIKQVSVRHMAAISEELLIYREMQENRLKTETVLQLYQTQIDRDSYLFIKQAYTDTLKSRIQTNKDLFSIESQVRDILISMEKRRFTLKTFPKVQDFVFCFDTLKVQNPGIFEYNQRKKIEIQSALLSLKDQMLEQLI